MNTEVMEKAQFGISLTSPDKDSEKIFQDRSELAVELISRKPDFFERWALLVFMSLLIAVVGLSWFISYPDIIHANAVLTGSNAPKEIVARQTGKLTALFVVTNQKVRQGDILAWIESTADTKEVVALAGILDSAVGISGSADPKMMTKVLRKEFGNLGELQSAYQVFIAAWQKYDDYLVNGFYNKKRLMLESDIQSLRIMENKLSEQKEYANQDNELAKMTFEMNERLFREKVISAEEYRRAKSGLLNKQIGDPQRDISIISQQSQIREKQKEIDQLDHDIFEQRLTFEQSLQTLRSNVSDWLYRYTIQAPTDGAVVFTLPLQQNQYLEQGKILAYVKPDDSKYHVEIKLDQRNFGKVDTGMKVQLRFDAYPYQEAGFVPGTLSYVSDVAIDSVFLGTVRLDQELSTNHHKHIQYKPGLKAQALIITKEMRMLERIYYSIIGATSMNK